MQLKISLVNIPDLRDSLIPEDFFTKNGLSCENPRLRDLPKPTEIIDEAVPDLFLVNLVAPDEHLFTWLKGVKAASPGTPVIVIGSNPTVTDAVECLKNGAFDFIDASTGWNGTLETKLLDSVRRAASSLKDQTAPAPDTVEQFYRIFDNAPLGYQSLDKDGNFLFVNEAWTATLGYTNEEMVGKSFGSVMPPEEAARFPQRFAGFKNTGLVSADIQLVDKWGNQRVARFNGRIGYQPNGEFDRTHCILLDLTERVELERQLRESEEKYRLLLDTSMDAVMLTHPDGGIFAANRAACQMLGMTEEEILQGGRDLVIDSDDPRLPGYLKERQETGRTSGVLTFTRKDKTRFEGEFTSAIFKTSQGKVMSSVVIRDISEKEKTLKNISDSETKYRLLIENQTDLIVSFDGGGKILYTNPSFRKFADVSETEAESRSFFSFISEDDKVNPGEFMKRIARKPRNQTMELRMQSKAGYQWIAWNNNATLDRQGNIQEVICIGRNIHEQKMAQITIQEQLLELKRWHETTLGREFRILELKKEVNQLLAESGKAPRYESAT